MHTNMMELPNQPPPLPLQPGLSTGCSSSPRENSIEYGPRLEENTSSSSSSALQQPCPDRYSINQSSSTSSSCSQPHWQQQQHHLQGLGLTSVSSNTSTPRVPLGESTGNPRPQAQDDESDRNNAFATTPTASTAPTHTSQHHLHHHHNYCPADQVHGGDSTTNTRKNDTSAEPFCHRQPLHNNSTSSLQTQRQNQQAHTTTPSSFTLPYDLSSPTTDTAATATLSNTPYSSSLTAANATTTLQGSSIGPDLHYVAGSLRHRRDATRYLRLRRAAATVTAAAAPSSSSSSIYASAAALAPATTAPIFPYVNPIYHCPKFQQYRHKQESRENRDKKWSEVLENSFLDAILLMPHMRRRKYTLRSKSSGRNMLISEYLRIAYLQGLRQGEKAIKNMERRRKQVSSHIQVLKNFLKERRCFHFFFSCEKDMASDKKSSQADKSFKDNPVLTALSQGRLPDVKPNYKYFEQLLLSDNTICIRPKTAWIYVCNPDVRMDEHGNAFTLEGKMLDPVLFPHLRENLKPEPDYDVHLGPRSPSGSRSKTILHEYSRNIQQATSTSTQDMVERLEQDFPAIGEKFKSCAEQEETLNAHNPIFHCDIIHLRTMLELPKIGAQFPANSGLCGMTMVTITRPELQSHSWNCVTIIQRPRELCRDGEDTVKTMVNEVGIQFTHRPGCELGGACDCATTRRSQDIKVGFPVTEWVSVLSKAAEYTNLNVTTIFDEEDECGSATPATIGKRAKTSCESEAARLIRQVCMVQEVVSSDPAAPPGPKGRPCWTRRALLVWTFDATVHADSKTGKLTTKTPGTHWRYMTLLDPTSQYHQSQVYISAEEAAAQAAAAAASASAVGPLAAVGMLPSGSSTSPAMGIELADTNSLLSPVAGYPSILSGNYTGNAWDSEVNTPPILPCVSNLSHQYHPSGHSSMTLSSHSAAASGFGDLDFGLATPPPSASAVSYIDSFDSALSMHAPTDTGSVSSYSLPQQHQSMNSLPFISSSAIPTNLEDSSFLSPVVGTLGDGLAGAGSYDDAGATALCDPSLGWDEATATDSISGMDASWYSQPHAAVLEPHKTHQASGQSSKKEEIANSDKPLWMHLPLSSPTAKLDFCLSPLGAGVDSSSAVQGHKNTPPPQTAATAPGPDNDAYALELLSQF